jgi:predicted heme/steroid binding protein
MSDAGVRQRIPKPSNTNSSTKTADDIPTAIEDQNRVLSILDIFRVLLTLLGVSCAVSYYITSGESFFYGHKAWYTNPNAVLRYFQGPLTLTPEQLATFNGTDPKQPIFLAINGTIFDVSAGRHSYGPGGGYSVFAGRDATRAFVTGCFLEDRTSDLRGAEEVYLPIEDPDEEISSGERKTRAERERREAKKKVLNEVRRWEGFYRNHAKYFEVGKLVGVNDYDGEPPVLCDVAQKGRPQRKNMNKARAAPGKPVQPQS